LIFQKDCSLCLDFGDKTGVTCAKEMRKYSKLLAAGKRYNTGGTGCKPCFFFTHALVGQVLLLLVSS
jgi:hypothetical protein